MEHNFQKRRISCLDTVLQQVQNGEQTLEIKLPEGLPDVGRVLMAWGQPVLRSKEWREDSIQFSGGMMVWVLYAPEDGSQEQCVEGWIPFQMQWELPENTPEGTFRIRCLTRFVDGRSTSPRKILLRAGLGVMAEAFAPRELEIAEPDAVPKDVALLQNTYPLRLPKEAGEKAFSLDEELFLPESAPRPEKLISYRMQPKVLDQRILADKLVLRGNADVHTLYRSETGQLHSWNFEVPFSQYADLEGEYGSDAQMDTALMPTSLDLELEEGGRMRLKGGVTAQYLVTDKQPVTVVEDAYSPTREMEYTTENLTMNTVLENRRENLYGEQTIPADANLAADIQFLPDFPLQRRTESGVEMEYPGQFQVLYYGEDGILRSATARWEGRQTIPAHENSRLTAIPMVPDAQAMTGNGQILVKAELPVEMRTTAAQSLPMVTDVELGQQRMPDPNRPSLILRRAGDSRLWDIARESGSTMEAIRNANGLQGEPKPDQMLLIPVP